MSDKQPDAIGYAVCLEARGLVAEAKEMRRLYDLNTTLQSCYKAAQLEITSLNTALSSLGQTKERLQRDAERYRCLRDESYQFTEDEICVSDTYFTTYFGEGLDTAVDQLIKRKICNQ